MIRPLRKAHRWIWMILSLLLPAIVVAGLAARRPTTPANPGFDWVRYR